MASHPVPVTVQEECYDGDGFLGLECGDDNDLCLAYSYWCRTDQVYTCSLLGNITSTDPVICSNSTFWEGRSCQYYYEEGRRCDGTNPGQCSYSYRPCSDSSEHVHRLPSLCPDPATLVYNRDTHPQCRDYCEECTQGQVTCHSGEMCIPQVGGGGGGGEGGGMYYTYNCPTPTKLSSTELEWVLLWWCNVRYVTLSRPI